MLLWLLENRKETAKINTLKNKNVLQDKNLLYFKMLKRKK